MQPLLLLLLLLLQFNRLGAVTCAFLAGPWTGRDPVQYTIAAVLLGIGVLLWGATVLFQRYLKFDPADPRWPDRDRFVLSKGHTACALYVTLAKRGFIPAGQDQMRALRSKGP